MTREEKRIELLQDFVSTLSVDGVDLEYHIDWGNTDTIEDFDDMTEMLSESGAFNIEVIYYGSAMEYLTQNDTSLTRSLGLAHEFGYTPDNINSELLASLIKSEDAREEWDEYSSEVDDFFYELEDKLDEYEEEEEE
tara:strand:+ start:184 stop:594 length:411 start_codon:yes stop_codon:yes gene_type:complete